MGLGAILSVLGVLLFLLVFGVLYVMFHGMAQLESRQDRLHYKRNGRLVNRFARWLAKYEAPHRHLSDLLESMRWPLQAGGFVLLCAVLFVTGAAGGIILFHSVKGAVLLAALLGAAPYLGLRMSLVQRQLNTQLDFLPAVELFYQCYLITGERQIRNASSGRWRRSGCSARFRVSLSSCTAICLSVEMMRQSSYICSISRSCVGGLLCPDFACGAR